MRSASSYNINTALENRSLPFSSAFLFRVVGRAFAFRDKRLKIKCEKRKKFLHNEDQTDVITTFRSLVYGDSPPCTLRQGRKTQIKRYQEGRCIRRMPTQFSSNTPQNLTPNPLEPYAKTISH
jgi:hypothetical protein